MQMLRVIGLISLGAIGGLAAANWLASDEGRPDELPGYYDEQPNDSVGISLPERIAALEATLDAEIARRQELEMLIGELLDQPGIASQADATGLAEGRGIGDAETLDRGPSPTSPGVDARGERLVAAGFTAEQAERILLLESELQLQSLHEAWEARRERFLAGEGAAAVVDPIRAELSEADYEKYRTARGQPTSVRVRQLLEQSPAVFAGLRPGDEIIRYNGLRVYSISDLNNASARGAAGEPVTIEVLRDGATIQLSIPRGPLGITSSFGRRR